jgi:hypothetical protein
MPSVPAIGSFATAGRSFVLGNPRATRRYPIERSGRVVELWRHQCLPA